MCVQNEVVSPKPEEQICLAELLRENENVFAKDEFDLGNFTTIEHGIDTQNAAPN